MGTILNVLLVSMSAGWKMQYAIGNQQGERDVCEGRFTKMSNNYLSYRQERRR